MTSLSPAEFAQKLDDMTVAETTQAIAERDEGLEKSWAERCAYFQRNEEKLEDDNERLRETLRAAVETARQGEELRKAENAWLTKRLGEAEWLVEHAGQTFAPWAWVARRNAFLASTPPPADSPVANDDEVDTSPECQDGVHQPYCRKYEPPVAPSPLDVEARLKRLSTRLSDEIVNRQDLETEVEKLEQRLEALQSKVNRQAEALEALRQELRGRVNERAAPPAPVVEPNAKWKGHWHHGPDCVGCKPKQPEAAEAGKHEYAAERNAAGFYLGRCRECGRNPSAEVHAMPKASR
jgi:chaperonin cofactor prefoldin